MKDLPENELLSAYLDGELTAAEQAYIGQFLADNPTARQALDQLRGVSMAVHDLPELRLGEDLSDRVLRQAERAILARSDESIASNLARPPEARRWQGLFRRVVASRGVAWSATALAIALLIMWSAPPERQRDIALAPQRVTPEAAPTADARQRGVPEMWAADKPRDDLSRRDSKEETATALKGAGPQEAPEFAAAPLPPGDAPTSQRLAGGLPPSPESGLARPRRAPATLLDSVEETPPVRRRFPAESERPAVEQPEGRGNAMALGEFEQDKAFTPADLPVLLVHFDVTPEAARQGAFDQILAGQQIPFHDGWAPPPSRAEQAAPQDANGMSGALPSRAKRQLAELDIRDGQSGGAFDVIFVEATPGQVVATLDQLAQLPDQFLAVSVQPAPGVVSQRSLTRFNRLAAAAQPKVSEERMQRLRSVTIPQPAFQAGPVKTADPQADNLAAPLFESADRESASPSSHSDDPQVATQGDKLFRYGGADGPEHWAPSVDAPLAGTAEPSLPDGQVGDAAETVERYRVLFVLRVVQPELLAAPATGPSEPGTYVDGAAAETDDNDH